VGRTGCNGLDLVKVHDTTGRAAHRGLGITQLAGRIVPHARAAPATPANDRSRWRQPC
jgi:hypothetical protein